MPLYQYRSTEEPGETGKKQRSAFVVGALAGAVAGALMVAIAWLGAAVLGSEDSPPDRDNTGQAAQPSTALPSTALPSTEVSANDDQTPTELSRCQEVLEAQSAPLQAAAVSLDQWEVHIGAMNKLVVGAITLPQATQFWNQTRVGASTNLKIFASSRERFQQRTARCPEPSSSGPDVPGLRPCYRAVAARQQTVHLASVSLGTWEHHVHHMEMLRRGEMTAQEATTLWLQSWRQGNDEVRAYRAAARTAKGKTC